MHDQGSNPKPHFWRCATDEITLIAPLLRFMGIVSSVLHLPFQNPYLQLGGGVVSALCAEAVFRFKRWIVGIGLIVVAIYLYLHQGK
jgi:hypothetical protein